MTTQATRISSRILSLPAVAALVVCTTSNAWALQGSAGNTATRTGGASGAGGSSPMTSAPEINPALIIGAVVLVVGAILIISSRRRRAAAGSNS
jgi:hypothetical protein